jgi:histidinol-phosphate phosphatase family protein
MLVYRAETRRVAPRASIAQLRAGLATARALPTGPARYDTLVALLIDAGALESAVADVLCPESDGILPPIALLHRATVALARATWHAWRNHWPESIPHLARADAELESLAGEELPATVELKVPEGFAHYGLYPETYFAAAEAFAAAHEGAAMCIGLRSIGSTLAACVAAVLMECGWQVDSCTVRPRGHPFDRHLALDWALAHALRRRSGWWHLVVDEGPGLSGSSISGSVASLAALGVPESRIVVFPSWASDGSTLRSEQAQRRWPSLVQQLATFEETWIASGRLADSFGGGTLQDLSAGAWRTCCYADPTEWPAVHPQHERRKYLLHTESSAPILLRFTGLGHWGAARRARAAALADTGFTPPPLAQQHGFLARDWLSGMVGRPGASDPTLLDTIGRYLAHLRSALPTEPGAFPAELERMIITNTAEALGADWGERARRVVVHAVWSERACAIDGRMLPQEWIRTPGAWIKVDSLDHGDGHFLPGAQDVAWDLAGAIVEFGLEGAAARELLQRYRAHSGDHTIGRRLPTYRLAYAAFRTGYASLAAETLRGTDDGQRFMELAARYAGVLRHQLLAGVRPAAPVPRRTSQIDLVIFDADDTLRETTVPGQPCPFAPNEWKLRPGVRRALQRFLRRRRPPYLGVASNQDRVGYGQLAFADAHRLLHDLARAAFGRELPDEAVQLCPHTPEERCRCRKPEAGMLEQIMHYYGVIPERTLFVGDAEADREAAARAGVAFATADAFFRHQPVPAGD